MVVGEDVNLNDIILTNATTLVGRFGGRKISADGVKIWVVGVWNDHISICLDVFILPRGWIDFKFHSKADAAIILTGFWRWQNSALLLKRWSSLFDPRVERYDLIPIWVKLPNLPFEFWSAEFFNLIGNTLGTFLEADLSFLDSGICCLGKVLVLLDLKNGLAEDILIKKGDFEFL